MIMSDCQRLRVFRDSAPQAGFAEPVMSGMSAAIMQRNWATVKPSQRFGTKPCKQCT